MQQREPLEAICSLAYLEPDDDIATICGKVDTATQQRVVLVASKGNKALASLLGMTILRRHTQATGRDIVFVSPKGALRVRARREGVRAFRAVRWVKFDTRPPSRLRLALGDTAIALPTYRLLWRIGLRLAVVAAALIAAYLFAPSATIVIHPIGRTVAQNLPVTASVNAAAVDLATATVPAHFTELPLEMTMALATTGKVAVGDGVAKGAVVFTNETDQQVVIPKGTQVAAQTGVAFVTTQEAMLPAGRGKQVEVPIQAAKAGSQGNVRATDITVLRGPLRSMALVSNAAPTSGGTDKEAQGVAAEDMDRLRALVVEVMRQQGLEALTQQQREEGVVIYPQTGRVLLTEADFSPQVGEPAPWLIVTARGRLRVLAIKEEHIRQLALHRLGEARPGEAIAWVLDGSFHTAGASLSQFDEETAKLEIETEMEVVDGLDKGRIVSDLRGRSASSARSYLTERLRLRQPPQIDITPGWGFGIPRFDWRINLKVEGPPKVAPKVEGKEEDGVQSQRGP